MILLSELLCCAAPPPPPPPPPAAPTKRTDGRVIATPYAKKLAKEMGIDLASIGGSGPNGRITASDVESAKNGGPLLVQRHTRSCTCISFALYEADQ